MAKYKTPRHIKSWSLANIILQRGLFNEFRVWCYQHPKVKSMYRAGNLFLLNKGLLYADIPSNYQFVSVNMDTLCDYYFNLCEELRSSNFYA